MLLSVCSVCISIYCHKPISELQQVSSSKRYGNTYLNIVRFLWGKTVIKHSKVSEINVFYGGRIIDKWLNSSPKAKVGSYVTVVLCACRLLHRGLAMADRLLLCPLSSWRSVIKTRCYFHESHNKLCILTEWKKLLHSHTERKNNFYHQERKKLPSFLHIGLCADNDIIHSNVIMGSPYNAMPSELY